MENIRAPLGAGHAERASAFEALCREARSCVRCPLLAERTAVLSEGNGNLSPRALFVAEAPGRRGADRTRVPMSGDASGRLFRRLLGLAGLRDEEIFVTNAVLCSPRAKTGANRPVSAREVANCTEFLRRTIELTRPPVVASIGAAALRALERVESHRLILFHDAARCVEWRGGWLVPLYHTSPQVLISTRSMSQQEADWRQLGRHLARLGV